jgi:hypothetical protein
VRDLNGDGDREIASIQGTMAGSMVWQVAQWSRRAGAYAVVGCAPFHQESAPPTPLDRNACPA